MTIRMDVAVEWEVSPRVITVAAPSGEITIQDLVDTCRYHEELLQNIDNSHLINAAGKEFLGGITYVGITATLQNAVLAFEARGGPAWELCIISGGNLVAVDGVGANIDPRLPTAFTSVDRSASSSATILVQSQDELVQALSSMADLVSRSVGLMQENYYLDQTQYSEYAGQQLLTNARIRLYNSPTGVGTNNNVSDTYLVTSTWSQNSLQDYKVVRQTTTTTTTTTI